MSDKCLSFEKIYENKMKISTEKVHMIVRGQRLRALF